MIVDGEKIASKKEKKLEQRIKKLNIPLCLGIVVFKGDPAGEKYSELKRQAGERVGIKVNILSMDFKDKRKIEEKVSQLNQDQLVTGVMIQYPGKKWAVDQGMERKVFESWWQKVVSLIDKPKDVDGLRPDSPYELGVVKAVEEIISLFAHGRTRIVVVGKRGFSGKAMIKKLRQLGYEVKGLGRVDDLVKEGSQADVLISVTGRPSLIRSEMVKRGSLVIDVGWPEADVDFDKVSKKAGMITPVPGGIGPISVVCLLENLVEAGYTSKRSTQIG